MHTLLLAVSLLLPAHAADADDPPGVWLGEARASMSAGDPGAARQAATTALRMPGDHQRQAQLIIASTFELEGRLDEALTLYEALADAYPRRDVPAALRLRLATTYGKQERWGPARRALRPLRRDTDLPPDRQLQVAMLEGLWDLDRGKEKRGLKRVTDALDRKAASPWWRAQGHDALFQYAVGLASAFPSGRTPTDLQQALEVRAQLVDMAQQQTVKLIQLDQGSLAREALVTLAELHEQTGIDVLTVTQDASDPRVEGLFVRALDYLERSQELARRTGAEAVILADLDARRARLEARIEGLGQGA